MKNKPHKQKFSSKRSLAQKEQGRSVTAALRRVGPKAVAVHGSSGDKERRKQAAEALRKKKNQHTLAEKRLGSSQGPPRIVGLLPANESANTIAMFQAIQEHCGVPTTDPTLPATVASTLSKQRLTLICEKEGSEQHCLDVAKVSDVILLCVDVSEAVQAIVRDIQSSDQLPADDDERLTNVTTSTWFSDIGLCITDQTRDLVKGINSQGCPSVIVALQGLDTYTNERKRAKTLNIHHRYFTSVLPEHTKVLPLDTDGSMDHLLRAVQVIKLRTLKWRDQHPYFAAEEGVYDPEARELTISGYLRGMNLSANQLVHLTNFGTYQVRCITGHGDPHALKHQRGAAEGATFDESAPETRESLECIKPSDTLEDDGLPTEEDVALEARATKRVLVPSGVSEYQAAWYEGENDPVADDVSAPAQQLTAGEAPDGDEEVIQFDTMSKRTGRSEVDFLKAADVLRHEKMTDAERVEEVERLRELSEEELNGPDVVDTPIHLPARQRFAKYRGLKSFHASPWDANENLPVEFGHIFKLQGYQHVRDAALSACAQGPAPAGAYVSVTLVDVPADVWGSTNLIIASGQLQHEQKWSVLHFQVQRSTELDEPIKSKTPMLAHIGFRKFYVSPVYSEATVGDRTKFARFFHEGDKFRIASFYGPICYSPCPILLFKATSLEEEADEAPLRLAAFGGALPPNPDFLIIKRAVLTGRIAVINKKSIVVKYMFFNDEDVRWFSPVDLYTRLGRRGNVLKPIGTKGLFKAQLNDMVMQHDCICMDLYKRVFPKWTTVAYNVNEVKGEVSMDVDE